MLSLSPLSKLLKFNDVQTVYFCSGSRNACLEKELSQNFRVIHHYEERQASFMALGESVQSERPVVVCTTSGTAALECLPAIAEAYFSQAKLILITADRPKRLRGTGAPQTLDQLTPFSSYVFEQIDCTLDELLNSSLLNSKFLNYPVQLNLKIDDASSSYPVLSSDFNVDDKHCSVELENFLKHHNPLVIISHGCSKLTTQALVKTFLKNNYIVYLEKTSNVYIDDDNDDTNYLIHLEKDVDTCVREGIIDSVIRIGHTPLTRLWRDLDRKYTTIPVLHFDPRGLQGLGRGKLIEIKDKMLESILLTINKNPNKNPKKNDFVASSLPLSLLSKYPMSEAAFFYKLNQNIPKGSKVYLGNSMPIRYWQMLAVKDHELYFNRGANGIDGQIATAIGVARSCDEKVYAIIGDLTAIYDLSCLFQALPSNLCIIIINNYGGRIFEQVGHSGNIINEHQISISDILANNKNCEIYSDPNHIKFDKSILELFPSLDDTRKFWNEWKGCNEW